MMNKDFEHRVFKFFYLVKSLQPTICVKQKVRMSFYLKSLLLQLPIEVSCFFPRSYIAGAPVAF